MKKRASEIIKKAKLRLRLINKKTLKFVDSRPLTSFFGVLGIVVLLIILGNFMHQPKKAEEVKKPQIKQTSVYRIGTAPRVTVQAQTKKSGVIQIAALTGGIVDSLSVKEGDAVKKGQLLLSLSSNYQGGNTLSLQRQVAQEQYKTTLDTYQTQKDLIARQHDKANKEDENSDKLRDITNQSLDETRSLISLNQDILTRMDDNLKTLEQNNGSSDAILSAKQAKTQYLASLNQAQQALRSNDYNASGDNPPAQLSDITKDIANKQLDVQEKQLDMNLEISRLQAAIAQVNESLLFPTAPFSGTIQRVYVKEKQQVTQSMPLLVISQTAEEDPISAVAFVSADIAKRVSLLEPSMLHIGEKISFEARPSFVSTEAVEGTLYAIYYPIPDEYNSSVVSEGFITVDVPIGYPDTSSIDPFVPLDSVYQTREKAYVFVYQDGVAKSKTVELGSVFGRFVEVTKGLLNGDQIITDRTVIDGDRIQIQ